MNKIKIALAAFAVVMGVAIAAPAVPAYASAASQMQTGVNQVGGNQNKTNLSSNIRTITNILLFVLGAIAVIMIIIGGIRYVTSNGDSTQVTSAKNTVLYSIVGLIVAILAYAIVNFVIDAFK